MDPEPEGPFLECRIRIAGYLRGCFTRGARFIYWDSAKFSRATRTRHPLGERHVQRVWTLYTRSSTAWDFELIRIGRSFRWKVKPAGAVEVEDPGLELRRRLVGYITGAVHRQTSVVVHAGFLGVFARKLGVSRSDVQRAAESITRIDGMAIRSSGSGSSFSLKVSPTHFSHRTSSPTGRKIKDKTTAGEAGQILRSSGGLRPLPGGLWPREFAVEGQWIDPARLVPLAFWLARGPLRLEHWDSCKVAWRLPHARNFALRALAGGHPAAAIVAAYAAGVRRSHGDAVDRGETASRPPSAAVVYARDALPSAEDPGARWLNFFAVDRRDRVAKIVSRKPEDKIMAENEFSEASARVKIKEAASWPIDTTGGRSITPGQALAWLERRGIDAACFCAMTHDERQKYISMARRDLGVPSAKDC